MKNKSIGSIKNSLIVKGKNILAADESKRTVTERFQKKGIPPTDENIRLYREWIVTTPGLEGYVSGIILFKETLGQADSHGKPFIETLQEKGIVIGVKSDEGLFKPEGWGENVTQMESPRKLVGTFKGYRETHGVQFTKYRSLFSIGPNTPSNRAIDINGAMMALDAIVSLEAGLFPIVEPEIERAGSHTIDQCSSYSTAVYTKLNDKLVQYGIPLSDVGVKTNFTVQGSATDGTIPPREVAKMTFQALAKGFGFYGVDSISLFFMLSGGLDDLSSGQYLHELNRFAAKGPFAKEKTFMASYSRAMLDKALDVWAGNPRNVEKAQQKLLERAKAYSEARTGKWDVKDYNWN